MKLALAVLLAGLAAQQPTFKSTTSLVEVDIIARDKDGRFVSGLTSDDFEVLEEGKPQAIQHFYLVTERANVTVEPRSDVVPSPLSRSDRSPGVHLLLRQRAPLGAGAAQAEGRRHGFRERRSSARPTSPASTSTARS